MSTKSQRRLTGLALFHIHYSMEIDIESTDLKVKSKENGTSPYPFRLSQKPIKWHLRESKFLFPGEHGPGPPRGLTRLCYGKTIMFFPGSAPD